MKKLQLLLSFFISLGLSLSLTWSAVGQSSVSTEARTATQRGFQYFERGEASAALEQWRIAEIAYRKQHSSEGIVGSQVNQNLALQQLGLFPRACATLVQALELTAQICQAGEEANDLWLEKVRVIPSTPAHFAGLNSLGVVLTALGKPEMALQVLQNTASLPSVSPSLQAQLFLSIANAESDRALTQKGQYEATDDDFQKVRFRQFKSEVQHLGV
jgi:tetratricopeptide (TPR) repeat protein